MPHQELYNKLFGENSNNGNPREMLQNITNEYPYFSLAHFYLLRETPSSDFVYRKVAAKTALHFNNPFLLKYQLNKKLKPVPLVSSAPEIPGASKPDAVEMDKQLEKVEVAETNPEMATMPGIPKNDATDNSGTAENMDTPHDVPNLPDVQSVEKVESVESMNTVDESSHAGNTDVAEKVYPKEEKEALLFEPLHTTDYFASQGIKLSEEVQAGDKLGKQLKSFTDWLKIMKKVHKGKMPEGNPNIDLAVQNLAEKSNKEQEVLTESMAEVYIQQGKPEKARDIYKKLSLLNPSKSAYFAAKIELLKEN